MNNLTPKEALNPGYRRMPITESSYKEFFDRLEDFIDNTCNNQSEDEQRSLLIKFLSKIFYDKYNISPLQPIDLAIRHENNKNVAVIVETKQIDSADMAKKDNLNKKAIRQLIYYYMQQRKSGNSDLRHLIATDMRKFFIFDAQEFEKYFFSNKEFKNKFYEFEDHKLLKVDRDYFYNKIAAPRIKEIEREIKFTYFNLNDYVTLIKKRQTTGKLLDIYKIFSPIHLLKQTFKNDSNHLNEKFYKELLHLIGLEEIKDNKKTYIHRKKIDGRNEASLLENTINSLSGEVISEKYGDTEEDRLFNVAMELCVVWINRILFLKLFEAQLLNYHNNSSEYKFLTYKKIPEFSALNHLFFKVMAIEPSQRTDSLSKNLFAKIPYLNSSLFELTDIERKYMSISNLMQSTDMPIMAKSVLRNDNFYKDKTQLPFLEYLFAFLDAYNFANDGVGEITEKPKTLINASVLGLIFEKINGYKDGSVYTPGFITSFMCKRVIEECVVDKFNEKYGWNLQCYDELFNKNFDKLEANDIINSIKICDPAVGSGHFLVAALNKLIHIKWELGCLYDASKKRLIKATDYEISLENDELIITDADHEIWTYKPGIMESQRVQEALFNEKSTIIENSLFGVDINPNSVNICRLRLWIELLKNAYYTSESQFTKLETLPNIDINIKCGNSLLYNYSLDNTIKYSGIKRYQELVKKYKESRSKADKAEIGKNIAEIKDKFRYEVHIKLLIEELKKQESKLNSLTSSLFNDEWTIKEKKAIGNKRKKIQKKIEHYNQLIDEEKNKQISKDIFEWRIEFPEVIDEDGYYEGFDIVIGNPPFIQLQKIATNYSKCGYEAYTGSGDIYCLFYEHGWKILKKGGHLCFITSNKWLRTKYGSNLRNFILENANPKLLIDFGGIQIFDKTAVDTNILYFTKSENNNKTCAIEIKKDDEKHLKHLEDFVAQNVIEVNFNPSSPWTIAPAELQSIKRKIESVGVPLKDWDIKINYGIKTGCNEAFIISTEKRNEILSMCEDENERKRTAELIRPILRGQDLKSYGYVWAEKWLIATFPSRNYNIDNYPALKNYFLSFGEKRLEQTGNVYFVDNYKIKARKKTNNKWFETQDSINYWDDFSKPKIIFPNMTKFKPFYYDEKGFYHNDKSFMIIGERLSFLTCFFNSLLFKICYKSYFPDLKEETSEIRKTNFEPIPVKQVDKKTDNEFRELMLIMQATQDNSIIKRIENKLYDLYGLTTREREYINSFEI